MSQAVPPPDLNGFTEAYASGPAASRLGFRCLGMAAAVAAIVGVVMPLWPTTPFALLAAWAFARSSPRLEAWLLGHRRLGPAIRAWRERRAIPRHAKAAAALGMPASWTGLWLADAGPAVLTGAAVVLAGAGLWVLSRPH